MLAANRCLRELFAGMGKDAFDQRGEQSAELSNSFTSNHGGKFLNFCESTRDVECCVVGASQYGLEVRFQLILK